MENMTSGISPWINKTCEAWRLWTDTSLQASRQLTDFTVNVAKEGISLYAEVYATNIEALQEGQSYVNHYLQEMPETLKRPGGMEQKFVHDVTVSTGKIGKLAQNEAQAVLRSSEQYWLTAQQTGNSLQETYTQLYTRLAALYKTA